MTRRGTHYARQKSARRRQSRSGAGETEPRALLVGGNAVRPPRKTKPLPRDPATALLGIHPDEPERTATQTHPRVSSSCIRNCRHLKATRTPSHG